MKKPHTTTKQNHAHALRVRLARERFDDARTAQGMASAVSQAYAQIQRPSRDAVETVRIKFTQRFLEAIK